MLQIRRKKLCRNSNYCSKGSKYSGIIDISNIDMRIKFWLEMNEVQACFYSKFEETLSNLK